MAIKTITLRPALAIEGIYDQNLSKICDRVADDDSTYYSGLNKDGNTISFSLGILDNEVLSDLIPHEHEYKLKDIRVYIRFSSSNANVKLSTSMDFFNVGEYSSETALNNLSYIGDAIVSTTNTYETTELHVDELFRFNSAITNCAFEGYTQMWAAMRIETSAPSSAKSNTVKLTQVYVEVDVEEMKHEVFIMHNNSWLEVTDAFLCYGGSNWTELLPSHLKKQLVGQAIEEGQSYVN